jgi:hypothetical protein
MADLILSKQYLPSGCGFKVVRVDDEYVWDSKYNFKNYKALRKWCRANCSGTFAYTPEPEIQYNAEKSSLGQWCQRSTQYFAFVDEEDITAVLLTMGMGTEGVKAKAMWPSRVMFTVIVRGL